MSLQVLAPAKLNLGLEVLGRRPDGFHEIRTIMATISLFDRLLVRPAPQSRFHVDDARLGGERNLVERAMRSIERDHEAVTSEVSLSKRIPLASGLGGASSDAAVALVALDRIFKLNLSEESKTNLALELGSDVPFFLSGGVALISGRGEVVSPLSPIENLFAVVVSPRIHIPAKTPTLYRSLVEADFSDGSRVAKSAARNGSGEGTDAFDLSNAFQRPLYSIVPQLKEIPEMLRECGAEHVALSGAGPSHFTLIRDLEKAHRIASAARARAGTAAAVHVVRFLPSGELINQTEGDAGNCP